MPALAGHSRSIRPTSTDQYSQISLTQGQHGRARSALGVTGRTGLGGNVGPLPFTGFDVIAMAAVALAVTGLGLALQRAVSREPSDELS